jgi:hypothetical protein
VRVLTPRLPATLALTALVLSIAGCAAEPAPPTATPSSPAATPLFANDEEALAAAEAAFAEYLATINLVLQEGGANPERVRPLVSDEIWARDLKGAERWRAEGLRTVGATSFMKARLQQVYEDEDRVNVVTYNCLSNEGVDVLNTDGVSVANPDRPEAYIVEATVTFSEEKEWSLDTYRDLEEIEKCESWLP